MKIQGATTRLSIKEEAPGKSPCKGPAMASEIMSTIIVVAVTIAIAVAVTAYITNTIPLFSSGPDVRILPDSTVDPSAGELCLHIANRGGTEAVIYHIELVGAGSTTATIILPPGSEQNLCIPVPGATQVPPGATRTVRLYTTNGYIITGIVTSQPGTASTTTAAGATGSTSVTATGLLTLEVTNAESINATITGTIAFETSTGITLIYTDGGTTSFGAGDTIQLENPSPEPLGPNGQTTLLSITATGSQLSLDINYLPAAQIIRGGNAVVATNKIIKCTSTGSTSTCTPVTITTIQLTPTITITLRNATVTATVDGQTVLDSTNYSGTITVAITQAQPPTTISYDPATKTLRIEGVKATITTT